VPRSLTDAFCKAVQPPAAGKTDVTDARCVGLEFRVTPAGAKSWSFRFRDPASRKLQRATLGAYPDIGLSKARELADEMRKQVAGGVNPIEKKRRERQEISSRAFGALAERYLVEHARRHKRERSADEDERNLKKHVLPKWTKKDYRTLKRADAIELIEGIVADGKQTAANRVHALVSKIFSFAVDADLIDANPVSRLRKRGKENVRRRLLAPEEIPVFWRGIVQKPVSPSLGYALRLALLTGTRANEVAGTALTELHDLGGGKPHWIIPGSRTKNKRDHLVPLTPLAVKTIREARRLVGEDDKFLFMSPVGGKGHVGAHALTVAMRRFCISLETEAGASLRDAHRSPHDLRRTFATQLAAMKVPKEDRDACLNHARADVGSKHYDLYDRADEKRAALNKFSRWIETTIAPMASESRSKAGRG